MDERSWTSIEPKSEADCQIWSRLDVPTGISDFGTLVETDLTKAVNLDNEPERKQAKMQVEDRQSHFR